MKTVKKKSFLRENYNQNREFFTPIKSITTALLETLGIILLGWLTNFIIKTVMHYDIVKVWCGTLENKILLFFANLSVCTALGDIEVIIITFIVFFIGDVYVCIMMIITKEIAIMRYCKLPITEKEIRQGIIDGLYSNMPEYFNFLRNQIAYGFPRQRLKISKDYIDTIIASCVEVFHIPQAEVEAFAISEFEVEFID